MGCIGRRVKNKTAAPIQITAEQIIREAREGQESSGEIRPPKQKITDPEELSDYRLRKRKEFEDQIRRPNDKKARFKYALWEGSQGEFDRARSIWERALDADHRNHTLWLKYADFEMKNRFINHARNVFDRAAALLPRVDRIWYSYIHMEEMLGNVAGARQVFERWVHWQPGPRGWSSYVKFERRYGEDARARAIYERFVACHPAVSAAWINYAKFETKMGEVAKARAVYEGAVGVLIEHGQEAEEVLVAFAEFEETNKETGRARCIYRYALDHVPMERALDLSAKFVDFEKRYGDREEIEAAIVARRRFQYEQEASAYPFNYDTWFDYIRLEESMGNEGAVREVYERAISHVPPAEHKRYWQRYIYLWINYALYEELAAQDTERTRQVYKACLNLIPHKKFSFAKIWILAAQFELRQKNLKRAREVMDDAIELAPKDKIFKKYIQIELGLGQIDHCRSLYEKYLEWAPANCYAWSKYAELERSLNELDRVRAVLELAIAQPALDIPELLWKAYIDFEICESEYERARQLYDRLLDRTKHLKVWVSYAKFEASLAIEVEDKDKDTHAQDNAEYKMECVQRCRGVFEKAIDCFKTSVPELREDRAMLLETWLNMESNFGCFGDLSIVQKKLPRKVKRKRAIRSADGGPAGYEEYVDYIFPDEVSRASNLKILEAAYQWKLK